ISREIKEIVVTNWALKFRPKATSVEFPLNIGIQGWRSDDKKEELYYSSVIRKRIRYAKFVFIFLCCSETKVQTFSGNIYVLDGPADEDAMAVNGFAAVVKVTPY